MKRSQKLAVDEVVSANFSCMSPQSRYVRERNLQSHHLRILQASFVNEVFRQHAVAGEVTGLRHIRSYSVLGTVEEMAR